MVENTPRFINSGLEHPLSESAVIIVGLNEDQWAALGSGIIIGNYIAITARHLIDGYIKYYHEEQHFESVETFVKRTSPDTRFSLYVIQFLNSGTKPVMWLVKAIYYSGLTDIVFLHLASMNEEDSEAHTFNRVKIDINPLIEGDSISGFGYICPHIEYDEHGPIIDGDGYTTTGFVTKVYETHRDRGLVTFPAYEVDARIDGGMSGGPVFNNKGLLCGILSVGGFASHVAALWPMLAIPVSYSRANVPMGTSYPASELAKNGVINCLGWERVEPVYDKAGVFIGAKLKKTHKG